MKRHVYVYSSLNGALTQSSFKRTFEVRESSALLPIDFCVHPGCFNLTSNHGKLEEGVVTHAEVKDESTQVLGIGIPTSTDDLREIFRKEGWEEVSDFLE